MYGMYFITGLLWSGVMLMLYTEIRNEVSTAVMVKKAYMIAVERYAERQVQNRVVLA